MRMNTTEYVVRRLQAGDAEGVVACVRKVYGDSYVIHTELYHPEQIIKLNETGHLISVVALDRANELVGHYALERPDLEARTAESGEAMVVPQHQHHQLLEQMRSLLEREAERLGLSGIFGRTVTNHVFSQQAVERFGEKPCGVSLGRTPRGFQNLREPLSQRMSVLFYFKYLRPVDTARLHLPPRHAGICRRIYSQFGVRVEAPEADSVGAVGELAVRCERDLQRAVILVGRVGQDSVASIRKVCQDLCNSHQPEVMYLELPLGQAGTPEVCEALREDGFFFSGVAPLYSPAGDVLRLQFLHVKLDASLLQIENPFARELLAYVEQDRRSIQQANTGSRAS